MLLSYKKKFLRFESNPKSYGLMFHIAFVDKEYLGIIYTFLQKCGNESLSNISISFGSE